MVEEIKNLKESSVPVQEMAEREYFHLQKAAEIEKQIESIQHSTKVDIPELAPIHNYLRMKYRWYYRWHMSKLAHLIQYVVLISYLGFWLWLFYRNR